MCKDTKNEMNNNKKASKKLTAAFVYLFDKIYFDCFLLFPIFATANN